MNTINGQDSISLGHLKSSEVEKFGCVGLPAPVMATLDKHKIKEIAENLDCGFRAFCHETCGELVFIIDTRRFPLADIEEVAEEYERLDANRDEYFEIEAMGSSDAFQVMVDFAEQLTNTRVQDTLFRALNRRGPFREFNFAIDNSGKFRQQWFDFKNQRYIEWVTQHVQAYQLRQNY